VIDETGKIAHEAGVYCALGTSEVVEGVIHAQTLPKHIDAAVDQLSAVNHQQIVLLNDFSRK
jgi:hypothetical protein